MKLATEDPEFHFEDEVRTRNQDKEFPDFLAPYIQVADILYFWRFERSVSKVFSIIILTILLKLNGSATGAMMPYDEGIIKTGIFVCAASLIIQCTRKKGKRELRQAVSTYDWFAQVVASKRFPNSQFEDLPGHFARLSRQEQVKVAIHGLNSLAFRHLRSEEAYKDMRGDEHRRMQAISDEQMFKGIHAAAFKFGLINEGYDRFYRWAEAEFRKSEAIS